MHVLITDTSNRWIHEMQIITPLVNQQINIFVLQEITTQQMMTHLNSVKKDLVILEKSEFSMLRSETEVCLKLLGLLLRLL